jgi:hypothetical protein
MNGTVGGFHRTINDTNAKTKSPDRESGAF